jgi:hypothetical protein
MVIPELDCESCARMGEGNPRSKKAKQTVVIKNNTQRIFISLFLTNPIKSI